MNEKEGICYMQPKTLADRLAIVKDFTARFRYAIPMVVDPMDNRAELEFGAWPERLYVVDADGRIAYQGQPGPKGFFPDEVEAWLVAHPLAVNATPQPAPSATAPPGPAGSGAR